MFWKVANILNKSNFYQWNDIFSVSVCTLDDINMNVKFSYHGNFHYEIEC